MRLTAFLTGLTFAETCDFVRFALEYVILTLILPFQLFKEDPYHRRRAWVNMASRRYNVQYLKLKGSENVYREGPSLICLNHQCIADYFVHDIITEHCGNTLTRMGFILAFPFLWFHERKSNSLWYFFRGENSGESKMEQFYAWLDKKFKTAMASRPAFLVYPEGHRTRTGKLQRLRTGILRYGFLRNLPTQIIYTSGQKEILDELTWHVIDRKRNKYPKILYKIEKPISPNQFKSFEEYYKAVEALFLQAEANVANVCLNSVGDSNYSKT